MLTLPFKGIAVLVAHQPTIRHFGSDERDQLDIIDADPALRQPCFGVPREIEVLRVHTAFSSSEWRANSVLRSSSKSSRSSRVSSGRAFNSANFDWNHAILSAS